MPTMTAILSAGALLVFCVSTPAQEPDVLPERRRPRPAAEPAAKKPEPKREAAESRPRPSVPTGSRPSSEPATPAPRAEISSPIEEILLESGSPRAPDLREKMGRKVSEEEERAHARETGPLGMAPRARERDAIDRLLDRLGGRTRFEALGKLQIERRLEGLDRHGESVFQHEFTHRIDAQRPRADEVQWNEHETFGRSGDRAWSRSSGIDRPDQEARVRKELEVWGLLARFPFVFADRVRFELESEQRVVLLGRSYVRLRLFERNGRTPMPYGPAAPAKAPPGRRFDVYLEAERGVPLLLEIVDGDRRLRVLFEDFREIRGTDVIVPMRRILLGGDLESPRSAIRWRRVERVREG